MNPQLNPFRDKTSDPRAEFRRQIALNPEVCGDTQSSSKVPFSGSELSYKEYNEVFEGDSWSFHLVNDGIFNVNLRPMTFVSSGDSDSAIYEKANEGFLGTSWGAKRSHAHFTLGGGEDVARFQGNSQRNIAVVEAGNGNKKIELELGGGDDKAVLYLSDVKGTIYVNGGDGEDALQIRSKDKNQKYEILVDPKDRDLKNDPSKLVIVTSSVEKIEEYCAGQFVSGFGQF
jgi:hypothetical protein